MEAKILLYVNLLQLSFLGVSYVALVFCYIILYLYFVVVKRFENIQELQYQSWFKTHNIIAYYLDREEDTVGVEKVAYTYTSTKLIFPQQSQTKLNNTH